MNAGFWQWWLILATRCSVELKLWPELPNYLVEVDKTEKKAKIAGWLSLIVAIFATYATL